MFEWLLIGATLVQPFGMCEMPPPKVETQVITAEVSAYTSRPEETDSTPFITASGARVGPGTLACPAHLEFGTKVIINGQTYVCEDRMNERYRYRNVFDIWMADLDSALAWGRRTIKVEILDG